MFSEIVKKIPAWLSTMLVFATLAFKDWENFFPLSSHSDLKFQIVGESLEVLALVGVFSLARLVFPQNKEISASASSATGRPIFAGAIFAAFLFVTYWRDSFPNDTFKFGETLKDVGYSLVAGVVVALFALIATARQGKPNKESEKSAA